MKNLLIKIGLILTVAFSNSCVEEVDLSTVYLNPEEEKEEIVESENKKVEIEVELPEGAAINLNDLKISSIFGFEDEEGNIEVPDADGSEIVFARNKEGNIVLMSYFNPKNTDKLTLNSETTAISLTMFHPWIMHLTPFAREEAYNEIKAMNAFNDYKQAVEQSISSGNTAPLNTTIVEELTTKMQVDITSIVMVEKYPLYFKADNGKYEIENKQSSFVYNVLLYNEQDELIQKNIIKGVDKSITSFSNMSAWLRGGDFFRPTMFETDYPNYDQEWRLVVENSFDCLYNSNDDCYTAQYENAINLVSTLANVVSTTWSDKIKVLISNLECSKRVAVILLDKNAIDLLKGSISGNSTEAFEALLVFLANLKDKIGEIVPYLKDCVEADTYGVDEFVKGIDDLLKYIKPIQVVSASVSVGTYLVDYILYDTEMEFCFEIKEGDAIKCDKGLGGDWETSYVEEPTCFGNGGAFLNSYMNGKTLSFIEVDSSEGLLTFSLNSNNNENFTLNNYTLINGIIKMEFTTEFNPRGNTEDSGSREFTFEGVYDQDSGVIEGDFTYKYRQQIRFSGAPSQTTNKTCNGKMKFVRK